MVRILAGDPASLNLALAPPAPAPRVAWGQVIIGLAAGFFLALMLWRPWQLPVPMTAALPPARPIARMELAWGPVEMKSASEIPFFACPTNAPLPRDSVVRTGPDARCEIALDDGNALRLDCNTEVTLRESEVVEVNRGRL